MIITPEQAGARSRNRRTLLVLLVLFLLPTVLAMLMFSSDSVWRPEGSTNAGNLISPVVPLPVETALSAPGQEPLRDQYLRGKWTMVYVGDAVCDETCREILYRMQQVRLAMGEDTGRVQRLYIAAQAVEAHAVAELRAVFPKLDVAVVDGKAGLVSLFDIELPAAGSRRVFIVDPLGNLMMYYESDQPPNGILRDLRKLLKNSQIG